MPLPEGCPEGKGVPRAGTAALLVWPDAKPAAGAVGAGRGGSPADAPRLERPLGEDRAVLGPQSHRQLPASPVVSTSPKNCGDSIGESFARSGARTKTRSGPNVPSSAFAGKPPAAGGPETNSQNGAKSVTAARSGA